MTAPTLPGLLAGPYRTAGGEPLEGMSPAEIWCWMNGWYWPGGRPVADGEERAVFRLCFQALYGGTSDAGLRLWRDRCESGLDPVTGGAKR